MAVAPSIGRRHARRCRFQDSRTAMTRGTDRPRPAGAGAPPRRHARSDRRGALGRVEVREGGTAGLGGGWRLWRELPPGESDRRSLRQRSAEGTSHAGAEPVVGLRLERIVGVARLVGAVVNRRGQARLRRRLLSTAAELGSRRCCEEERQDQDDPAPRTPRRVAPSGRPGRYRTVPHGSARCGGCRPFHGAI